MNNDELNELRGELARVSKKTGQTGGTSDGKRVVMPESDGVVVCRILPALSGRIRDLYVATRTHNINNRWIQCPKAISGDRWTGNCPICDYYSWLWKESDKRKGSDEGAQLQATARSLRPNERYTYVVVVKAQTGIYRDGKQNSLGVPLILGMGKELHGLILSQMLGNDQIREKGLGAVYDLNAGRDFKLIKLSKRGSDNKTYPSYNTSKFDDPSPAGTADEIAMWMANLPDLSSLKETKTIDELKREIRIHRGAEKDYAEGGFDPSEYDNHNVSSSNEEYAPAASYSPPVVKVEARQEVPKPVVVEAPKPLETPPIDKALLDDDFVKQLMASRKS